MRTSTKGALAFIVLILLAFQVGSYILTATFFGLLSLIGLIVLIESIGPLKWLLARTSKVFDMLLFVFTILATVGYGLNIAASLTVAGLGYTLVYGPWLREQRTRTKPRTKQNYKSNFNSK